MERLGGKKLLIVSSDSSDESLLKPLRRWGYMLYAVTNIQTIKSALQKH